MKKYMRRVSAILLSGILVLATFPAVVTAAVEERTARGPVRIDFREGFARIYDPESSFTDPTGEPWMKNLFDSSLLLYQSEPAIPWEGGDTMIPTSRLGLGVLNKNLRLSGNGPKFSEAVRRVAAQNKTLLKILEGPGPVTSTELRALGLSVFDEASHQTLDREDPANFLDPEIYTQALTSYGLSHDYVHQLLKYSAKSHSRQPADAFSGPVLATVRANLMTRFIDSHNTYLRPDSIYRLNPSDKAELLLAALLHMTDANSERPKDASPNIERILRTNDPYLEAVVNVIYGPAPINKERVHIWMISAVADPSLREALIRKFGLTDADWKMNGLYRPGFGRPWKDVINFVSRAAPFILGHEFTYEAIRARAQELRRDAELAGLDPARISDSQVVLAARVEAERIKTHPARLQLREAAPALHEIFWEDTLASLDSTMEKILQQLNLSEPQSSHP